MKLTLVVDDPELARRYERQVEVESVERAVPVLAAFAAECYRDDEAHARPPYNGAVLPADVATLYATIEREGVVYDASGVLIADLRE